ncbi:MAG TPA: lamin tail domain-containing protein, partial [Candidatus Dormibacteraeota bacterium]|nr:lamin tail domain-containing protein [Candidatus Dormibacteraeota bacterium]
SPSSSDVVFGVSLEAYVPPAPGTLVLSEILADNRGSALNANRAPDYIELHNTGTLPFNLNGMSISDNVERPGKYVLPPDTIVPAGGYLVLWCDDATNAPGLHTGFALDNDGQTVALFVAAPGGYELADAITFGLQAPDYSIGRSPPPGNSWSLNTPTPGGPNIPVTLGTPASLRINEWMASNPDGPDWFEIYNPSANPVPLGGCYVTDKFVNPTNSRLAPLSFIAPFAFRQLIADNDEQASARHVGFQLSAGGEAIALYDPAVNEIDSVVFGPQTSGISQGRLPDGNATFAFFPGSASPENPNFLLIPDLVVNEVLPHLELRNTGSSPIDLGGLWLSDDPAQLQKYQIPAGNQIPPGGFWWAEGDALPLTFDLLAGGRVYLSRDGGYRTSAKYGAYDGFPYGTVQTTVGQDFVQLSAESFGAPNPPPRVGPIVIGEIQYHPPDLPDDDDQYEFVELVNISGGPVPLFDPAHPANRWRLRDACSFTFPPGITLAPGETVLVAGFDPTNETARANFQMVYGLAPGLRLFGPYDGKLDNSGASVELVKPAPPVTTPGPGYESVAEILIDRVQYSDTFPWPDGADGSGHSLQRKVLTAYGNEPTNWTAAAVSPGGPNTANLPPTVTLTAPSPGSSFNAFQPLTMTANAQDPDGSILRVEFFADGLKIGEDWTAPFSFAWSNAPMGAHVLFARATDRRLDTAQSAPVNVSATNAPPSVVLTAPAPGSIFSIPTVVMLQATATDADGSIAKVEFFANGQKVGETTTSPYSLAWSNLTVGTFDLTARATDSFGLVKTSAPVSVRLDRNSFVAYVVPSGTLGGANYINGLGADFDVASPILVTSLGVFDNAGDGIHASSTMTAQIYRRNGSTGTLLASMQFLSTSYGKLIDGSRFKVLPQSLMLTNGSYSIACYGFSASNRLGDLNVQSKTWSTDSGGGLINFVGSSRFGLPTPGVFPSTNLSGGAVDNFAAGTFEFRRLPTQPVIIDSPTSAVAR